jgi:antitoxin HicB
VSKESKNLDHTGSSFDNFLEEENLLEEAEGVALKRVISWQLKAAMNEKHLSKTQMAQQLNTSRSQVERLLDPGYVGVSIGTIAKAAHVVGKRFSFEFTEEKPSKIRRAKARPAAVGA